MNSYRFLSGQEPSDEMLSQLMSEVAEEAVERRKRADEEHFSQMAGRGLRRAPFPTVRRRTRGVYGV